MNRRSFLKSLAGISAATAIPLTLTKEWADTEKTPPTLSYDPAKGKDQTILASYTDGKIWAGDFVGIDSHGKIAPLSHDNGGDINLIGVAIKTQQTPGLYFLEDVALL